MRWLFDTFRAKFCFAALACVLAMPAAPKQLYCSLITFNYTIGLLTVCFDCQYSHSCVVVHSYLNEPWAMAIYHDRFSDFRDEVRELLISRPVCILYFIQSWRRHKLDCHQRVQTSTKPSNLNQKWSRIQIQISRFIQIRISGCLSDHSKNVVDSLPVILPSLAKISRWSYETNLLKSPIPQ